MSAFPVILSAPSGGGKTTIARALLAARDDLGYSVSCTTRPMREGETNGVDYFFITTAEFEQARRRGEFAESAEVHGHLYGTLRREVDRVLDAARHVIMDIDVQGARQFVVAYPESVLVFVIPPSAAALVERLSARGTEGAGSLVRRLRSAVEELKAVDIYGYLVINDNLETAVRTVSGVIDAESSRLARVQDYRSRVSDMVAELERELQHMARDR